MIKIDATDIIEHLITLSELAKECTHVTEMGVRDCVSTWPFIDGLAKNKGSLVSIDINAPPAGNLLAVQEICEIKEVGFKFRLGDTRTIEIEPTDLLFIDTNHTTEHLRRELELHADKAKKYIVLHDTESCKELWVAIGELLAKGKWKVKTHYQNNNGLTVLEKV